MKITCLIDNCAIDGFKSEHGLSYYVEAAGKRFFFDLGATDAFLDNARALGIDPASVDFAVVSHGHYDHGGGIAAFMAANPTAKIYIRSGAFDKHYSDKPAEGLHYIGLDEALENSSRIVETGDLYEICPGIVLFSAVTGDELHSTANDILLGSDAKTPDDFGHEQDLLIVEGDKRVLIDGCAHRGIVNIINRLFNIDPTPPSAVFGGMHLAIPGTDAVDTALVDGTAERLLAVPGTVYYTGHCTGLPSFARLKERMGERVQYMHAGESVEI